MAKLDLELAQFLFIILPFHFLLFGKLLQAHRSSSFWRDRGSPPPGTARSRAKPLLAHEANAFCSSGSGELLMVLST
jgi:hypothetical protein